MRAERAPRAPLLCMRCGLALNRGQRQWGFKKICGYVCTDFGAPPPPVPRCLVAAVAVAAGRVWWADCSATPGFCRRARAWCRATRRRRAGAALFQKRGRASGLFASPQSRRRWGNRRGNRGRSAAGVRLPGRCHGHTAPTRCRARKSAGRGAGQLARDQKRVVCAGLLSVVGRQTSRRRRDDAEHGTHDAADAGGLHHFCEVVKAGHGGGLGVWSVAERGGEKRRSGIDSGMGCAAP